MIRLEQLTAEDGPRLRAIRLRALQDAPDAFSSTLEEAAARPPDDWSRQLLELPTFLAVSNGLDVGMVRCARDGTSIGTAWLISMWVAPEVRRKGVGAALVDAVIAWARSNDVTRLLLDVADQNTSAIALYARKGFARNEVVAAFPPPREHIREHQWELRLGLLRPEAKAKATHG
jgi:GNAT superfamily N-acetyltransferase